MPGNRHLLRLSFSKTNIGHPRKYLIKFIMKKYKTTSYSLTDAQQKSHNPKKSWLIKLKFFYALSKLFSKNKSRMDLRSETPHRGDCAAIGGGMSGCIKAACQL